MEIAATKMAIGSAKAMAVSAVLSRLRRRFCNNT
jgi:hypothetical protein